MTPLSCTVVTTRMRWLELRHEILSLWSDCSLFVFSFSSTSRIIRLALKLQLNTSVISSWISIRNSGIRMEMFLTVPYFWSNTCSDCFLFVSSFSSTSSHSTTRISCAFSNFPYSTEIRSCSTESTRKSIRLSIRFSRRTSWWIKDKNRWATINMFSYYFCLLCVLGLTNAQFAIYMSLFFVAVCVLVFFLLVDNKYFFFFCIHRGRTQQTSFLRSVLLFLVRHIVLILSIL